VTIPHWLLVAVTTLLCVGPVATILLWGFIWYRVERTIRIVPTLRFGQTLARADPPVGRVCVVVPAYNEARVIAGLIGSLRAENYRQVRYVLALDRCTDDTAAIARAEIGGDERFEIVEIDTCPNDWAGKVHAVHAGVTRSRGAVDAEYLLFADADTLFAPGCIASALALMRHRRLDLLSLLSTLRHQTWFERVVQTAAALELMRQFPLTRVNGIDGRRAFANGQFMLFRRDAYDAIGGHEAVKEALLEDLALARNIDAGGRRMGLFFADGLFHCRMYADWMQFRRGWKRIYTEAASRKAKRLSAWGLRIRWLGTIFPLWMLAAGPLGALIIPRDATRGWTVVALSGAALLIWLGALARITWLAHAPQWTAPLHIVGAWLTANVLGEAARDLRSRTPTKWGGREYNLGADKA
jgi:cellulose synthase/poly-beta-1,6-N-acetylglucosamine synthase-like glycosyltransferase